MRADHKQKTLNSNEAAVMGFPLRFSFTDFPTFSHISPIDHLHAYKQADGVAINCSSLIRHNERLVGQLAYILACLTWPNGRVVYALGNNYPIFRQPKSRHIQVCCVCQFEQNWAISSKL